MSYPSTVAYLLIGKETTWGTAVTATKDCGLLVSDVTPNLEREIIESQSISSIETQSVDTGIADPSISIEGEFQHGRLFEFIIGAASHANISSDWKHTFAVSNDPGSMTAEKGNNSTADTQWITDGLICESAELSIELNGKLRLSSEWKGHSVSNGTTGKVAVISTLPVFPHALCEVKINTTAADEVQKASISINKVVEGAGGIGSNVYQQRHATELKFEFSAELGFSDTTFHQLSFGGTSLVTTGNPTSFEFEINADNGVTLGSGRREIVFALENCQSKGFQEATSIGGLTFVTISGSGTLKELYTVDNISDVNWL